MSTAERTSQGALLARALLQLRDARNRLRDTQRAWREPIAVIGAGVRTPGGAADLDGLWQLLATGADVVSRLVHDVDGHRDQYGRPDDGGSGDGRRGGMLPSVDGFDAEFFGMSAAEAAHLDPQQRLVLETAWEAVEDAGLPPDRLRGSETGVFLGLYGADYLNLQLAGHADITTYTAPGGAHSIAANRLSYLLDLHGPSLAVDTACSSSLIAVHLACRALRNRDCDHALVGGVNVIINAAATVMTEMVLPLSPSGRCRTFDAAADGIVRAEGCGMLLLQRAADARTDGRRVRATIRGTAANHNGRTNGLTAPSPRPQVELMRRALADGDVEAADVGYVEAHGTGTRLGDPIEVEALREVYGAGDRPCALGSVKTNFGHQEAAAGVMGLLKAMLALEHRQVPAHLHLTRLNPEIDLAGTRLRVPTAPAPLAPAPDGRPPLAAVSSFGFGGANAHVILQAEPSTPQPLPAAPPPLDAAASPQPLVLPLSARSPGALAALVGRFADRLDGAGDDAAAEICAAAALTRTHHSHRLAVAATDRADLVRRLRAAPAARVRPADPGDRRVAFVLSGQGSQWEGMGRELLDRYPLVRAEVEAAEAVIGERAGWSVLAALTGSDGGRGLVATETAQVAIGVLELGLAALWRSWGVEPHAVVGHSMGEVVAARLAGALDLEETLELLLLRARQTERAARGGRMANIGLPESDVARLVRTDGGVVGIAAVNAPGSTVVSGERAAVERVTAAARAAGAVTRPLRVDYGFHSPLLGDAAAALAATAPTGRRTGAGPALYSTVSGARIAATDLDGGHWARNLSAPVLFRSALTALARDGMTVFVEIGPHPVLLRDIAATLEEIDVPHVAVGSLRRGRAAGESLHRSVAHLYQAGLDVRWDGLVRARGHHVDLPLYPWQRRRHWLAVHERETARTPAGPPAPRVGGGLSTAADEAAAGPVADARKAAIDYLRRHLADALDLADPTLVDSRARLVELALSSLMIVDLRNRIEQDLLVTVPLQILLAGATIVDLADRIAGALATDGPPGASGGVRRGPGSGS